MPDSPLNPLSLPRDLDEWRRFAEERPAERLDRVAAIDARLIAEPDLSLRDRLALWNEADIALAEAAAPSHLLSESHPDPAVREVIESTYVFDEVRLEPVTVQETRSPDGALEWRLTSPSLHLVVGVGRRRPLGSPSQPRWRSGDARARTKTRQLPTQRAGRAPAPPMLLLLQPLPRAGGDPRTVAAQACRRGPQRAWSGKPWRR
jgi:hypothetical protein